MVDLQTCLPTPLLHNAQSFYSLKLWSFNYTIHDSTKKKPRLMWDESVGGRGGNEIASSLVSYMSAMKDSESEHIIVWSDNCPSQNHNIQMILGYFYIMTIKQSIKIIDHKFLLRGHTHMEVDSIHSQIEREMKRLPSFAIMTPWDWQQLARMCGTKNKFEVVEMEIPDFKNFNNLIDNSNSLYCLNKQKNKKLESPGTLYFKTSFTDENFEEIDFNRKSRSRIKPTITGMELRPVRENRRPISTQKYNHLQKLLKWIPSRFHHFYNTLPHENSQNNDDDV
ncbi:hypothetical protein NQ314_008820 [Rhamnusium bicolor]|uniref:DUF7869 domain-containing protein n=1 Tax=Rhamnusium bicolor TaxID=1586634 RepID=A0AAV8Y7U8_9CUCU|nr:hypothetical protein NQ314_008820 [Rhamnusium bicolor]